MKAQNRFCEEGGGGKDGSEGIFFSRKNRMVNLSLKELWRAQSTSRRRIRVIG